MYSYIKTKATLSLPQLLLPVAMIIFGFVPMLLLTPSASAQTASASCSQFSGATKNKCVSAVNKCKQDNPAGSAPLSQCIVRAQNNASSADASSSEEACKNKIKKAECVTAVKSCTTQSCITNKSSKYSNVFAPCRNTPDPQTCHQAVTKKCQGLNGDALRVCRSTTAATAAVTAGVASTSDGAAFDLSASGTKGYTCGAAPYEVVKTSIDFGCRGEGSPIEDFAFAIIRFLSFGVGLVIAASIIYAGIMYSTSSGNAENTQAAKKRILNAIVGLIFYMLIFALIQYLVPGGLFKP